SAAPHSPTPATPNADHQPPTPHHCAQTAHPTDPGWTQSDPNRRDHPPPHRSPTTAAAAPEQSPADHPRPPWQKPAPHPQPPPTAPTRTPRNTHTPPQHQARPT